MEKNIVTQTNGYNIVDHNIHGGKMASTVRIGPDPSSSPWLAKKKVRMVKKRARKGCVFLARETRTVIMQELFDEVYVGEDHTPAAISFQLQLVKSVTGEAGKTWGEK